MIWSKFVGHAFPSAVPLMQGIASSLGQGETDNIRSSLQTELEKVDVGAHGDVGYVITNIARDELDIRVEEDIAGH